MQDRAFAVYVLFDCGVFKKKISRAIREQRNFSAYMIGSEMLVK